MKKIAIVTPYHRETDDILDQCRHSVRDQTHPCTHILVADGVPNPRIETDEHTIHLVLPWENRDQGNTPRYFGALLAATADFDAVAFLDADNWYEPHHVASLVATQAALGGSLVTSKRKFWSDDNVRLDFTEFEEEQNQHVDTNCWLILKEAFELLRFWRVPKGCAWAGDRIFLQKVINDRYPICFTNNRTVNYRTRHADHFRQAGLPVPPHALEMEGLNHARRYARSVEGVTALVKLLGFFPQF